MRLLTDENIGLEVVEFLRFQGHDVSSVIEESRGISDPEVLKIALKENRLIITSDTDFGELVYHQKLPHKGIVLLRLVDETNANKIKVLSGLLKTYKDQFKNKFAVATEGKIRIRTPKQSLV